MPRALISVSDKTGVVEFARALAVRGYEIISTGGTAQTLQAAEVTVANVSDITGVPEMLDGRIKTLHPAVHGGILARRRRSEDLQALARHRIGLIDIVAVNLYPFIQAAANLQTPFDALIEEIDIGGPSLVRAAAKNFPDVLVIVSPFDYGPALEELDRPGGPRAEFRFDLARKAFAHTAAYDSAIAATLSTVELSDGRFARRPESGFPARLAMPLAKIRNLRYGENPHQAAAWYAGEPPSGLGAAEVIQGKELSFTNLMDLDAAARIVQDFGEPAAVVIKHTNPCGAAIGSDIVQAYVSAREADNLAAFGGIVGLNRAIDEETARAIVTTFIEAVIAPDVTDGARPILAAKPNMRVVVARLNRGEQELLDRDEIRTISGAALIQERDHVREARETWSSDTATATGLKVVTRRTPTKDEWQALRFAWRVCAHVKSNAVVFASEHQTLAIGAGQMSRVDAVAVARMKAGDSSKLKGSVAASDAFFPFRDGLDAVAEAGASAVVQPGGSVRDPEVIAAADEHGLAMVFTGRRHFRH